MNGGGVASRNAFPFRRALLAAGYASVAAPGIAQPDSLANTAPTPTVTDPMLAPPAPAPREVRSWDEALNLIRTRSPDYLAGHDEVLRAQAQQRIALAQVLPTLNGQASYTHQFFNEQFGFGGVSFVIPVPNVVVFGGTAAWNVLNPRGYYGVGTAKRNVSATKASFQNERRAIAMNAVDAMMVEIAAERAVEVNRNGLRASLELKVLTETRLAYSQGTPLDVDRADQNVETARAEVIRGDEALIRARENLGLVLGVPTPLGTSTRLDMAQFEQAVARTCRLNDAIERRPDVVAARLRLEIARRQVHDVELQFVPSGGVASTLSYATEASLGPKMTWSLQGFVNVPLYEGGARYGALRDARAAADQAEQELVRVRLQSLVDAARSARQVNYSRALRDVARQQRDLAQSIDRRTREAYAHGYGSSLDLVISSRALRDADLALALREVDVTQAQADATLENAECSY